MRNTVIAVGLFVCAFGILSTKDVSAAELHLATITKSGESAQRSDAVDIALSPVLETDKRTSQDVTNNKPITKHAVRSGESLSTIAKKYDTTWRRLYDKNIKVKDPNLIAAGQVIVIPRANEKLKSRKLPAAAVVSLAQATNARPQTSAASPQASPAPRSVSRGSSAGNSYYAGYCTWYAKSRRPDMPNNLGNADTWAVRAAAQGFATGSTPRAGAIGQQGMHVVYVERVNRNGTVTVSEMNYQGFGVVSSRTVPASTFRYIY